MAQAKTDLTTTLGMKKEPDLPPSFLLHLGSLVQTFLQEKPEKRDQHSDSERRETYEGPLRTVPERGAASTERRHERSSSARR